MVLVPLLSALALLAPPARAQSLSDAQLATVRSDLWLGATQTWELGTAAEALTEALAPAFAVFANASIPPPASLPANVTYVWPSGTSGITATSTLYYNASALAPPLQIAYNAAANRSNATGPQPFIYVEGGAAGDPASLGVAFLLANWTGADEPPLNQPRVNASTNETLPGEGKGVTYARAIDEQLEYTLTVVPRTSDGAISHRIEQVQLWADSVYMVPPFLAYAGILQDNKTLLTEAYTQIKLYRQYLYDSKMSMWRHILLGYNNHDPGFWSTGNAWAAAGMLRVLSTMVHSQYESDMSNEINDLKNWVAEIHNGMYSYLDQDSYLFHNYANDSSTFLDASSTALLASTVYRLALAGAVYRHLPLAEKCREALSASGPYAAWGTGNGVGPASSLTANASAGSSAAPSATYNVSTSSFAPLSTSYTYDTATYVTDAAGTAPSSQPVATTSGAYASYAVPSPSSQSEGAGLLHFSPQMWLGPVVDPYDWSVQGGSSPEGQAFVVEMYAAWRDWVEAGAIGAQGAAGRVGVSMFGLAASVVLGLVLLL
ncbi:hypothetical protein WOLCODRAFT_133503 [Wolfiporia cocos MD-104 SS10]|uniref:Six-hairpin glycosidase n=1 Tax=Wolfiporia cocos (strain MD-104) TaxID=742152 RepID=A0A2H3IX09_WOLCO|nr:hypothetical protein WOLCODRAFT_133503 [Wolfiporia cocos MD-104 SS10]